MKSTCSRPRCAHPCLPPLFFPRKPPTQETTNAHYASIVEAKRAGRIFPSVNDAAEDTCSICSSPLMGVSATEIQEPYDTPTYRREVEVLRAFPRCRHAFHTNCIAKYIFDGNLFACPVCFSAIRSTDVALLAEARPEMQHNVQIHSHTTQTGINHIMIDNDTGSMVRSVDPNDVITYYTGAAGAERILFEEFNDQRVVYMDAYETDNGLLYRKVKTEWPNGTVWYFEGDSDQEHLVQVVFRDITTDYGGEKENEYIVSRQFGDGTVIFYDGTQKGHERMQRILLPNGTFIHLTGPGGQERVERTVTLDDTEEMTPPHT